MSALPRRARFLALATVLATISAGILMALRVGTAVSFTEPRLVVSSGAEEEAVMSLFRAMAGEPYADPMKLPFSASYYNFLFYLIYGGLGRWASLWGAASEWLTTIWRLTSLVVTVAWFAVAVATLRIMGARLGRSLAFGLTGAAFVAIGPLVGYWSMSLNPELLAATLSAAALVALAASYDRHPLEAVLAATALSLLAWSLKQSYLFAALALGLFLAWRRDWRGLAVTVAIHAGCILMVLSLGSDAYRRQLLSHAEIAWAGWQLSRNLINLLVKIAPFAAGSILTILAIGKRLPSDTAGQVAWIGLLAALPAIPFSAKVGASENYFFLLSLSLAAISCRTISGLSTRGWPVWPTAALTLVWLMEALACLAVISGRQGTVSLDAMHARYTAQRPCIADLPSPFYSPDPYLALPWMHPGEPHIVPAYYYNDDRFRGRTFEHGGIGGMIATGSMAAVAVAHSDQPPVIDGTPLAPTYMKKRPDCAGLDIWVPASKPQD